MVKEFLVMMGWVRVILLVVFAGALHLGLARLRVSAFVSPLHDEPITLLASAATQRAYLEAEYGVIKPASYWQDFTRVQRKASFADIATSVTRHDKHPPLAFWLFNRWLVGQGGGGYAESLWLCHLLVLSAGALTAVAAWQVWRTWTAATFAGFLFLLGNSGVLTSSYVRQYALLVLITAAHLCVAIALARGGRTRPRDLALAAALALLALAGMLTQYLFAIATLPVYAALLTRLWRDQRRAVAISLVAFCACAAALLPVLFPGVLVHLGSVGDSEALGHSWTRALAGVPSMLLPIPAFAPQRAVAAAALVGIVGLGMVSWRWSRTSGHEPRGLLLAGMAGPFFLQLPLVATGHFPAWATSAVYLAPLWNVIAVASAGPITSIQQPSWRRAAQILLPGLLALVQALFAVWTLRNPRPESASLARLNPGLVLVDRPERGLVLPLVLPLSPEQPVLVMAEGEICARLQQADIRSLGSVLWFLEGPGMKSRAQRVGARLMEKGWSVKPLATRHPGSHEALWLTPPER